MPESCAVAFSGGTDSTCAAAVLAERFSSVHLLTFEELGTRGGPVPTRNVEKLRERFPDVEFVHKVLPVDRLVARFSYHRYLRTLMRHGLFTLSTCGFSSLSWHVRLLEYCRANGIKHAADGLTRELMHFPGHMDGFNARARALYSAFGVTYENPVREWAVPPDQRFMDRLVVDPHGFPLIPGSTPERPAKTTGRRLFELGITPSPNVKGSEYDRQMQHDCYPFILFHVFAFWYALPLYGVAGYEARMDALFADKFEEARELLADRAALAPLVEG